MVRRGALAGSAPADQAGWRQSRLWSRADGVTSRRYPDISHGTNWFVLEVVDQVLYLLAGNGAPNFGDELLVQYWLRFYRGLGYNGPIIVDGKGASATAALLKDFGNVTFVKRIPRHADGAAGSYASFYEQGVEYARSNLSKFKGVQGFHFLGGGYACANWRNATRLLGAVVELGRQLSIPVVATGLGIAPFRKVFPIGAAAWRKILEGCQLFECRDAASVEALQAIVGPCPSLAEGLDDAFLYPVQTVGHSGRWLHLSGFNAKSVLGPTREEGPRLFDQFDRVVFWACSNGDAELYEAIATQFPQVEVLDNHSLLNEGLPLAANDFMLTGRFHPHLQAARVGLSGYFTANSDFYRMKHGLVTALGSNFRQLRGEFELFAGPGDAIRRQDEERVHRKQSVARRVAHLVGVI